MDFTQIVEETAALGMNLYDLALWQDGEISFWQYVPCNRCNDSYSVAKVYTMTAVGLLFSEGRLTLRLTPQAWVCAVLVALLAAVVACVLFQAGVRIVGKANAAIFSLLEPITSIVFSVLLLGDALSPAKLTGCALILAGLLVTALYKPPKT